MAIVMWKPRATKLRLTAWVTLVATLTGPAGLASAAPSVPGAAPPPRGAPPLVASTASQPGKLVTDTPWSQLPHVARYLKAVKLRVARRREQPQKDRERSALLEPLVRQYEARAESRAREGIRDPELERYRWLLEEWRVSLFAQELKTREPVSEKRLADQWLKVAP